MKLLTSTLLLGAATASLSPPQQVLQASQKFTEQLSHKVSDASSTVLDDLQKTYGKMSAEARSVWDEIAGMFPEAMARATHFTPPKPHKRRPDSAWDHVLRGEDVQSVWVEGKNGQREREVDGKLANFDLRVKKVDPSALGVDPGVKQYSGYLDDNENDKHLFYCEYPTFNKFSLSCCSKIFTIQAYGREKKQQCHHGLAQRDRISITLDHVLVLASPYQSASLRFGGGFNHSPIRFLTIFMLCI